MFLVIYPCLFYIFINMFFYIIDSRFIHLELYFLPHLIRLILLPLLLYSTKLTLLLSPVPLCNHHWTVANLPLGCCCCLQMLQCGTFRASHMKKELFFSFAFFTLLFLYIFFYSGCVFFLAATSAFSSLFGIVLLLFFLVFYSDFLERNSC